MSFERFVRQESIRTRRTTRRSDSFLDQARCPLCRHPLVARVGNEGPYWHCGCWREVVDSSERNESAKEAITMMAKAA